MTDFQSEPESTPDATTVSAPQPKRRRLLSFSMRNLMVLVTLCAIGIFAKLQYDWQQKLKLVEKWTDPYMDPTYPESTDPWGVTLNPYMAPVLVSEGKEFTNSEQVQLLETFAKHADSPERQVAAVKLLVEVLPGDSLPSLRRIAGSHAIVEVQVCAVRLLGICRDTNSVPIIEQLLKSKSAAVRTAAVDALGLIREPSHEIPLQGNHYAIWMKSSPPIFLTTLVQAVHNKGLKARARTADVPRIPKSIPAEIRQDFVDKMVLGETLEERSAAANALIAWPPKQYRLRVAEWGVWINDGGEMKLFQSIIDEIPDFVHRTGDTLTELAAARVDTIMIVTKPIVHVTTDQPMAVEIAVQIRQGKPWFVYPRPDDYSISVLSISGSTTGSGIDRLVKWGRRTNGLTDNDMPVGEFLLPLKDCGEGYRWIIPSHRRVRGLINVTRGGSNDIFAAGVIWQNVIVTPEKQRWTKLPKVPSDPNFAWWDRLRSVPSCWVSNRGESERFLYYDGPTDAESPVRATLSGNVLSISSETIDYETQQWNTTAVSRQQTQGVFRQGIKRTSIFVEVTENEVSGQLITSEDGLKYVILDPVARFTGDDVEDLLLKLCINYGLTKDEALGLIDVWRPQFFETKGRRLLTIMDSQDYDQLCPLHMRPDPSELVRLGIVLTEF